MDAKSGQSFTMAMRLKQLREERRLSRQKLSERLAEDLGVSISKDSLINYEVSNEHHPAAFKNMGMSVKNLCALAKFYNVSADYILGCDSVEKKQLEFSWKYKNYELRACTQFLARFTLGEPNETIDFVCWKKDGTGRDYCFSLAYFERHKEGYDLKFVGDNPFNYISYEDLPFVWDALSKAQKVLNDFFTEFNEE